MSEKYWDKSQGLARTFSPNPTLYLETVHWYGQVTRWDGHPVHPQWEAMIRHKLSFPSRGSNQHKVKCALQHRKRGSHVSGHILELTFHILCSGRPKSGKATVSPNAWFSLCRKPWFPLQCKTKYHHLNIKWHSNSFWACAQYRHSKKGGTPNTCMLIISGMTILIYTLRHRRNCNKSLRDSIFLQSPWPGLSTPTSVQPSASFISSDI